MEARGSAQAITAEVPLATMFGYSTDVRSMTQGRATYTMQFSRYAPVPTHVTESIVERMRGALRCNASRRKERTTTWPKKNSYETSRT